MSVITEDENVSNITNLDDVLGDENVVFHEVNSKRSLQLGFSISKIASTGSVYMEK